MTVYQFSVKDKLFVFYPDLFADLDNKEDLYAFLKEIQTPISDLQEWLNEKKRDSSYDSCKFYGLETIECISSISRAFIKYIESYNSMSTKLLKDFLLYSLSGLVSSNTFVLAISNIAKIIAEV